MVYLDRMGPVGQASPLAPSPRRRSGPLEILCLRIHSLRHLDREEPLQDTHRGIPGAIGGFPSGRASRSKAPSRFAPAARLQSPVCHHNGLLQNACRDILKWSADVLGEGWGSKRSTSRVVSLHRDNYLKSEMAPWGVSIVREDDAGAPTPRQAWLHREPP